MSPDVSTKGSCGLSAGNPAASLLQDCLSCGVVVVNTQGQIVACTAEAAKQLQIVGEELLNQADNTLPAPLPALIHDSASSGQPVINREIVLVSSREDTITLRASLLPVKTGAESQMVVVVLSDFASTPQFEQNMRRLDRLASLGTLSASLAHEIKNGMVAIKTFIDLLHQKGQETELTEVVNRELQRINMIVSQMLRFAAPKGTSFATVHGHELLDHSLRLLHHQISGKQISLQRRYEAKSDTVHGHAGQLQQAFLNLLLNAVEAMDANGVLTVSTEVCPANDGIAHLWIHIQDTGVGITRENLGRLFEPFFTTKKDGTGLGLAISQRIAHEHHGLIQAKSEVNHGSTFSFSLPLFSG